MNTLYQGDEPMERVLATDPQPLPSQLPSLADLADLDGPALCALYQSLFSRPPYCPRPDYIRKRLAYRIQELESGGLATWAKYELEQATCSLPARWKFILDVKRPDPRLPPAGTILRKTYRGEVHEVAVLEDGGFEYRGRKYSSLTAVARTIGNGSWNPFVLLAAELGLNRPKVIAGDHAADRSLAPVIAQIGLSFLLQHALDQRVATIKDLASQSGCARPRISQLLDLALLAPAIIDDLLLGLPRGRVWPITEEGLREIAKIGPWNKQVEVWTTPQDA
jgi:hypothetical protein